MPVSRRLHRLPAASAAEGSGTSMTVRPGKGSEDLTRSTPAADPAARAAVLAEAEALVLEAAPIVPIYFNTHVFLLHPSVKGWQPTPMDHSDYRYVWLEK